MSATFTAVAVGEGDQGRRRSHWVQLNHYGRQSNPLDLGHTPVTPSPAPLNFPGAAKPRELTPDEIDRFATDAVDQRLAGERQFRLFLR